MISKIVSLACLFVTVLTASCNLLPEDSKPRTDALLPLVTVDSSRAIPEYGAIPTRQQLQWQKMEQIMFIHFGMNTFTNKEWGDGSENPSDFNPINLDARQWVQTAVNAGFKGIVFTAKHHDGFALWPTKYSDHSIARSPWKNGEGDVVAELARACAEAGIKLGIYLSPWDRHESTYKTLAYNDFFNGQLTELLTQYGPILRSGSMAPAMRKPRCCMIIHDSIARSASTSQMH